MLNFPSVRVVGMNFRGPDAVEAAKNLAEGTTLRIEREPDNAHDPNAIKVFYQDLWLGYLERGQAAWIAPNMDEDRKFITTVIAVAEEPFKNGKINYVPLVEVTEADAGE